MACNTVHTFFSDQPSPPGNPVSFHARCFLVLGGITAALAVILGAAGMHALRDHLAAHDPAGWFPLALQYQLIHSLGLILAGLAAANFPASRYFPWAGWLLFAGIILFCGSLYLRSLAGIHTLHGVTPFGGASYIAGWLVFAIGAYKLSGEENR